MFAYIYQNTGPAITKAFTYLVSAIKYLDDSKDPFEAGDLIEVRESVEYAEPPQMSAELIAKILSNIKDPEKIANLMQLNRSWYREGSRRLYKDRDELMNWLRLNRIEQLDPFMRYLKLDRLEEYRRFNNSIVNEYKEVKEHLAKMREEQETADNNLFRYLHEYRTDIEMQPTVSAGFDIFEELGILRDDDDDDYEGRKLNQYGGDEELIPPILYKYFDNDRYEDDLIQIMHNEYGNLTFKRRHVPKYEELLKIYSDKGVAVVKDILETGKLHSQWVEYQAFANETINREWKILN